MEQGQDYAIVIGISRDLPEAEKALKAFARWLIASDGGGLPQGNVTDFGGAPQSVDIQDAFIGLQNTSGRRLYIYAAGRGQHPNLGVFISSPEDPTAFLNLISEAES